MARPRHSFYAGNRARHHRRQLTVSEARLWGEIKAGATGTCFRRQVPIGPYIADFASLHPKIVIEVDDTSHDWKDETERTGYLESLGFKVLRFTNKEIAQDVDAAVNTIRYWVELLTAG